MGSSEDLFLVKTCLVLQKYNSESSWNNCAASNQTSCSASSGCHGIYGARVQAFRPPGMALRRMKEFKDH